MTAADPNPTTPAPASATPPPTRGGPAVSEIVLIALVVLSAIGVAVSQVSPPKAFRYWLVMVPIFGGVSLFSSWSGARESGMTAWAVLRGQVLHWVGLAVAVCLIFLLEANGRLGEADAGIVTLLTLALATFLAGVHFDWRYCIVGGLLAAAVVALAVLSSFLWLIAAAALAFAIFLVVRATRANTSPQ